MNETLDVIIGIVAVVTPIMATEVLRRIARLERCVDTLPCRAALPLANSDKRPAACVKVRKARGG